MRVGCGDLAEEETEAADCETDAHESEAGANPGEEGALGGEVDSRVLFDGLVLCGVHGGIVSCYGLPWIFADDTDQEQATANTPFAKYTNGSVQMTSWLIGKSFWSC